MKKLNNLRKYIMTGRAVKATGLCEELVEEKVDPQEIIREVLLPVMGELSTNYETEKISIPLLLMASKALNDCIRTLQRQAGNSVEISAAKEITVVIGTIKGDIHTIGKNIVGYLLQSYGFTLYDLGTNVDGKKFIDAVYRYDADCVVISAMLTSTMVHLKEAAAEINREPFDKRPKIIIGGAQITEEFAREIGTEYGYTAIDTLNKLQEMFAERIKGQRP